MPVRRSHLLTAGPLRKAVEAVDGTLARSGANASGLAAAAFLVGPPLRTGPMVAHHLATGLTAWLSLQGHCMYYAIYFAGVIEATNIPLTWMDLCTCAPASARLTHSPRALP